MVLFKIYCRYLSITLEDFRCIFCIFYSLHFAYFTLYSSPMPTLPALFQKDYTLSCHTLEAHTVQAHCTHVYVECKVHAACIQNAWRVCAERMSEIMECIKFVASSSDERKRGREDEGKRGKYDFNHRLTSKSI